MGSTALHCACELGNASASQLLIDCGATIEMLDGSGRSALFLAAEAAWPLAAYAMLHRPGRLPFVLLACAPLLVAAAAAVGLLLASRAAGMGPASTVALAPAVAVAVAADAVGWTLAAWRTRGD